MTDARGRLEEIFLLQGGFQDSKSRLDASHLKGNAMKKSGLILLLVFAIGLVFFSTWQLYAGNLPASFSTLPFLLITYLFVIRLRR
jgi:hypothetical protein